MVGREHELAVLRSFVQARRGPAALVLEGDAGIGKTTLWEAGLAIARAADQRVLRCRPTAAESQLSFAAVADLLADVLDEGLPALPVPPTRVGRRRGRRSPGRGRPARLGTALSRPVLRRLHAESGGNPFYALELGRALRRHGSAPRPDEPLPVPDTLAQLVLERVAALPDYVRRLLELVATLYDRRTAGVRELADAEGLSGAIDAAVAAGVLAVEGERLEFTHPLLASGVYASMGPERPSLAV